MSLLSGLHDGCVSFYRKRSLGAALNVHAHLVQDRNMSANTRTPLAVRDPRTGEIDLHIIPASASEIAATAARLKEAQPAWAAAPLEHRMSIMKEWADRLKAHRAALIAADSLDTGHGQISRVAPDMVINAILRTCA